MKTQATALLQLIRPTHWVKNLFIFAPLFFTPQLVNFPNVLQTIYAVIVFSITASSIYVLNDCRDCLSDRHHPSKKFRPIASQKISLHTGLALFVTLSFIGLVLAAFLSQALFWVVLSYYLLNLAYCFALKQIALIDVYCIAAGFLLRITAGAIIIQVTPSVWILACTGLLALFIALAKRRNDLTNDLDEAHRKSIKGYNLAFIDTATAIILSALFISYTTYTALPSLSAHLGTTHFYYTVPIVLLGTLRYLQITLVEDRSGSPTQLLYTDKFLLLTALAWLCMAGLLIYLP